MEIKTSFVATSYFLCLLGFSSLTNSQTDSCNSNLKIVGIPFNTTSLICQPVWSSEDFILRYQQNGPSLWNFLLSVPDKSSYVAIGFSPNGRMVGSSSIVGWVPTGSNGVIKQYFLGGMKPQTCTPDKGELEVANMTIVSRSSRLYLAFQLKTTQPNPNLIYAIGPQNSFPASPDYFMSEHRSQTSATLNFVAGKSTTNTTTDSSSTKNKSSGGRNTYGVFSILALILPMFI
ncbi:PREDICTED: cytochrome b561 and DOMON domain-containing protein At3g07570-like [Nelumbo nucifera]|uniref:Cytochrome b561 and DOMON domain-containing protein At3g07570-like n=2 Tax=Nelumbo nucifera TaxID=4432 RepID=A0A1U8AAA0_NELNU|nr:PREDICTED: cytochrome b561 and DOMON domain-containing protein At3g07570-like [Nelumbo nucifera]DAD43459.1 TPA_asm: hypothetical protein HUJ06_001689 [Nelumbo nucifera]